MAVSIGRKISVLAGVIAGALALVVPVSPASAQIPPGAQATPIVGGPSAVCPPGSPGAVVGVTQTINGVTVYGPAGGQCTPLNATTSGEYSIVGVTSGPLRFNAACANTGGTVTTDGFVDVPAGTRIAGGAPVATTTPIEGTNVAVIFPDGRTAIVNQVITTDTSVTRNAIAFTGGPIVGQVICGPAVYPLAVETASGASASPAPLAPLTASGDDGGVSTTLLLAGAFALVVAAQLVIGRRVWRRKGNATS